MESIFLIILGAGLLYFAIRLRTKTKKLIQTGEQTDGIVFDFAESSNPNYQTKYPIIRFVTSKKVWVTEQYTISPYSGFFKKGQKVSVIYNPDNPTEFIIKSGLNHIVFLCVSILAVLIIAGGIYRYLHIGHLSP